jgi:hypothetical protein
MELSCSAHVSNEFGADARIFELLLGGRPSAIPRLVMSVAVNSINRMLRRRPGTHIGIEGLETVSPSAAYANASGSVEFVGNVRLVFAPLDHAPPYSVLGSRSRESMRRVRFLCSLFAVAPTTRCVAGLKVGHADHDVGATVANAIHSANCGISVSSDFWCRLGNYRKAAELHPNIILA